MIDPSLRREGWHLHSSLHLWEELLAQTRRTSRDHSALSEVYGGHITQRCNQVNEDLQRVFRRVSCGVLYWSFLLTNAISE